MPTAPTTLADLQLFEAVKTQIISLATALYGTTHPTHTTAFDVLSYTTPAVDEDCATYGVALIVYTGPASSPFTAWEILSHVDKQASVNAGVEKLLEDLRIAVGRVDMRLSGDWKVWHAKVPDIAGGDDDQVVGLGDEKVESFPEGVQSWSPTLDDIEEESEDDDR